MSQPQRGYVATNEILRFLSFSQCRTLIVMRLDQSQLERDDLLLKMPAAQQKSPLNLRSKQLQVISVLEGT